MEPLGALGIIFWTLRRAALYPAELRVPGAGGACAGGTLAEGVSRGNRGLWLQAGAAWLSFRPRSHVRNRVGCAAPPRGPALQSTLTPVEAHLHPYSQFPSRRRLRGRHPGGMGSSRSMQPLSAVSTWGSFPNSKSAIAAARHSDKPRFTSGRSVAPFANAWNVYIVLSNETTMTASMKAPTAPHERCCAPCGPNFPLPQALLCIIDRAIGW